MGEKLLMTLQTGRLDGTGRARQGFGGLCLAVLISFDRRTICETSNSAGMPPGNNFKMRRFLTALCLLTAYFLQPYGKLEQMVAAAIPRTIPANPKHPVNSRPAMRCGTQVARRSKNNRPT
jgi:hypothetical protein